MIPPTTWIQSNMLRILQIIEFKKTAVPQPTSKMFGKFLIPQNYLPMFGSHIDWLDIGHRFLTKRIILTKLIYSSN